MLMMDAVGIRSTRHFEQRRWDDELELRKEVGWVGGEEDDEDAVEVEMVELRRRRRKGMLGKR